MSRLQLGVRLGPDDGWFALERQEAIADAEGEVGAVAFDRDRRFVVVDEGEDVNVSILAGAEGITEEVP
jgi:hypothetical protein